MSRQWLVRLPGCSACGVTVGLVEVARELLCRRCVAALRLARRGGQALSSAEFVLLVSKTARAPYEAAGVRLPRSPLGESL